MKKVLITLLLIMLLSSCATTDESSYLELAQNATTLDEKIEYYKQGLNTYPENINYIYNTAYTLALKEEYVEAEQILEKGIYHYPKAIYLYTLLSHCYKAESKLHSYEMVMENLLNLDPGFIEAREEIITYYLSFGKAEKALKHAKALYEFYPDNKIALNALATLKGGVFENYKLDNPIKKAEDLTKPYLPPIDIKLEEIYYYLKSDAFLSRFLPSDHKAH